MSKRNHPFDKVLIQLLQSQGLIKSEAQQKLQKEVYRLSPPDIERIQYHATHFGESAKQEIIKEILSYKREEYFNRLHDQCNHPFSLSSSY
ncbi:hypothetical protein ACQEXU_03565 [Vibrio sp. TRT 21S02]|uniref:hypothetical protein n=1 Tax=unclassified Vibrio TaxID=2614977 RepID=UPI00349F531D